MKYNKITFCWSMLTLILLSFGCEDRRLNNMVDDTVYFLHAGVSEQKVFEGSTSPLEIMVVKGGAGKQSGAVHVSVDASLLEKPGEQYTLLPEKYYTVKSSSLTFKDSDHSLPLQIEMDAAGIDALQRETALKYALPLNLKGSDGLKMSDAESCYTIVVPKVMKPYLQFKNPGVSPSTVNISILSSASETLSYVFLKTNYHNQNDLSFNVAVDEAALIRYNLANETDHKLLPAASYRLDQSTFQLRQLNNEGAISLYLLKSGLAKGSYWLPLSITKVEKHGIDPQASTTFIPVSIQN